MNAEIGQMLKTIETLMRTAVHMPHTLSPVENVLVETMVFLLHTLRHIEAEVGAHKELITLLDSQIEHLTARLESREGMVRTESLQMRERLAARISALERICKA